MLLDILKWAGIVFSAGTILSLAFVWRMLVLSDRREAREQAAEMRCRLRLRATP